jgi:hypothetical protein
LGAVETLGHHSVSIQVHPWMRAVILRAGVKDPASFQKYLCDEAAKESTEAVKGERPNELLKLESFI